MIYFFEIPTFLDNTEISKLPKPGCGSPQDIITLQNAEKLRSEFKNVADGTKALDIIEKGDSVINYQKALDAYLKATIDVMSILCLKQSFPPNFRYKTFLTKSKSEYTTNSKSNEEACACEVMMARYAYAFTMMLDAYPFLKEIRDSINATYTDISNGAEGLVKNINMVLTRLEAGYIPLYKLCGVMNDLLKSLAKSSESLIPEFKPSILVSVKIIYEVNANYLYVEKLRLLKDFKQIAKVCKGCNIKAKTAFERLQEQLKDIKPEVLYYCLVSLKYFKAQGYWALIHINHQMIAVEDQGKKNFTQVSLENLVIAREIVKINEELKKKEIDADYYDVCVEIFNELLLPLANKCIKTQEGIYHGRPNLPDPESIFNSIESSLDYLESNVKK